MRKVKPLVNWRRRSKRKRPTVDENVRYWITPKGLAAIGKLDKAKAS